MTSAMNSVPPPFRKLPLAGQVAETLRLYLKQGVWESQLPPERALSERWAVSRPVLRQALHRLRDEGLLVIEPGRGVKVGGAPPGGRKAPAAARRAVFLLSRSPTTLERDTALTLDALRVRLRTRDCELEVLSDLRLQRKNPGAILRELVSRHPADHWILASVPRGVQAWFEGQRLSTVVFGHAFQGFDLPSVDHDHRVVARHAAGVFLGLGHRRVVCFSRRDAAAGDLAMEEGFLEGFRKAPEAELQVIHHSGEVSDIREKLQRLLDRPRRPTALFVSHVMDVPPVFCALLRSGLRIPDDISLISRQRATFLDRLVPSPACYDLNPLALAAKLGMLIDNPNAHNGRIRILPPLIKGASLAPVAAIRMMVDSCIRGSATRLSSPKSGGVAHP